MARGVTESFRVSLLRKRGMVVQVSSYAYEYLFANILPILWRRKKAICLSVLLASAAAFLFYSAVGDRYEAYTLVRIGQGIKERAAGGNSPFGEGIDLTSRMDSLAKIGATDHVIRQAALSVGLDRLFDDQNSTLLAKLRRAVLQYNFLNKETKADESEALSQAVIEGLRGNISARQEGRSDLLRISFKHPNPSVVAEFVNGLANSLVATQADLVQVPGADVFFQQQARRLEQEAEKAATELREFSIEASIYSAAEQRALLLRRAADLATLMATTRGSIEERKGQKQAIVDQLLVLRPVAQSKTVTSIVNRLGERDDKDKTSASKDRSSSRAGAAGNLASFDETPPLLLVRVYQDAMANLLKINSDLSGSLKLEKLLGDELERVNVQLADLTSKEAEYDRLKRVLTRASSAADLYGTRVIEEQTSMDVAKKAQLSSVRVVQLAEKPIAPTIPRIGHLVALALFGGLALGAAIAVMLELARLRQQQLLADSIDDTIDEFARPPRRAGRGILAAE